MPVIKDIRIYRSCVQNITGNAFPQSFCNMRLSCVIRRIVMKLREKGFLMDGFDHLYVNLTTCEVSGGISPAEREKDRYHPWYRYYDAHISQDMYDILSEPNCTDDVIRIVEEVLKKCPCTTDPDVIHSCVSEAVEMGADMTMKFREKKTARNKAVVYLRYLDNGRFSPLLKVWDNEDTLLLEKDLPETNSLDAYGDIRLSSKQVTVRPRKNAASDALEPMTFML